MPGRLLTSLSLSPRQTTLRKAEHELTNEHLHQLVIANDADWPGTTHSICGNPRQTPWGYLIMGWHRREGKTRFNLFLISNTGKYVGIVKTGTIATRKEANWIANRLSSSVTAPETEPYLSLVQGKAV